ncbi:Eukaryotic/viral aspartic protease [Phytophthora megakarya]|uniref:Eukaryotic/viral aspartic protease n=1 Tax=Phytophthora megakarya TaxID=4795 RepID=A0A225W3Z2_9STRA|nr:Eukaryotic/viral aspartic protease [Phytophthora megakarya]
MLVGRRGAQQRRNDELSRDSGRPVERFPLNSREVWEVRVLQGRTGPDCCWDLTHQELNCWKDYEVLSGVTGLKTPSLAYTSKSWFHGKLNSVIICGQGGNPGHSISLAHVALETEQTESTANPRPGTRRNSSRRQVPADDSSSDEGNPFYQDDDENDATTELAWQIRELTAMEEMYPTSRIEIAQHRPLGKITPFRGKLDESENSMQWLRGFV